MCMNVLMSQALDEICKCLLLEAPQYQTPFLPIHVMLGEV